MCWASSHHHIIDYFPITAPKCFISYVWRTTFSSWRLTSPASQSECLLLLAFCLLKHLFFSGKQTAPWLWECCWQAAFFQWACRGMVRRGPNSEQRSGLCSRDKEGVWFLTQPEREGVWGWVRILQPERSRTPVWRELLRFLFAHMKKNTSKKKKIPLRVQTHSSATRGPAASGPSPHSSLNESARFVWGRMLGWVRRRFPCVGTEACVRSGIYQTPHMHKANCVSRQEPLILSIKPLPCSR